MKAFRVDASNLGSISLENNKISDLPCVGGEIKVACYTEKELQEKVTFESVKVTYKENGKNKQKTFFCPKEYVLFCAKIKGEYTSNFNLRMVK